MKLDMIKDERLAVLQARIKYLQRRVAHGEGNSHYQREEIRALGWAITLIRHAAERGILEDLQKERVGHA